ncbi:MAG: hypothetical protein ACI9OJ_003433 [Myxococcota bacterium]|jgi:hypothetical protein
MNRIVAASFVAAVFIGALLLSGSAFSQGHKAVETVGSWRFSQDDRPVKVITLAGSIGAWGKGNFSDFIRFTCDKVEVKNLAKTGYGAWALKDRFKKKVLRNRRLNLKTMPNERWLIYGGGMNSVGMPEQTNSYMAETFVLAHQIGMKVVGLSLTPWGDEKDKRWRGFSGLKRKWNTQKIVDFIMGRLPRYIALNRPHSKGAAPEDIDEASKWLEGEQADIGIDLYDSGLRHQDAPLRDEEKLRRRLRRDKKLWRDHGTEAEALTAASELPRWFMRKELRAFDHIHPNSKGHRIIAETACAKLPPSWACQCDRLANARWEKGRIVSQ